MTEDVNVRLPGTINVKVTLDSAVLEILRPRELAFSELQGMQAETEDPLEDVMWLIQHGIHMTIGINEQHEPYVRVLPISGMVPTMYSGQPLERSLRKMRQEIERLLEGRQPTGPPGQ